MLHNLKDICQLYLKQSTSYLDGAIGNPFAPVKDSLYCVGIMMFDHNVLAICSLYKQIKWKPVKCFQRYFKYFITIAPIEYFINVIENLSSHVDIRHKKDVSEYIILLLNGFPQYYGDIYIRYYIWLPDDYKASSLILNITGLCEFYYKSIIYSGLEIVIGNQLREYINRRSVVECAESINSYYDGDYFKHGSWLDYDRTIIKLIRAIKYGGNMADVDKFERVIGNHRLMDTRQGKYYLLKM